MQCVQHGNDNRVHASRSACCGMLRCCATHACEHTVDNTALAIMYYARCCTPYDECSDPLHGEIQASRNSQPPVCSTRGLVTFKMVKSTMLPAEFEATRQHCDTAE
jgi:hypothetical protein